MKKFLKSICVTLSMVIAFSIFTLPARAARQARYDLPFEPNAQAYVLVSLDTGEVLFEKNSDKQLIPASLTKLLTAYTVMKYVDDLDGTMVSAPRYIYDELFGHNSSTADIRQGETLSVRDLLYALLLPSANEAASILADYVGKGSIENFCMMMNNEAKKLGCTNTNFTNAHGLFFDNHYTSAYDMYLIAKACYETPGFMDIATTVTYELPQINSRYPNGWFIQSTVRMQSRTSPYYRSYIRGMKTGSLPEIGHNFVSTSRKNGENYILVVMGASTDKEKSAAFTTTAEIMDFFFENYSLRSANSLTYPVTDVKLKYAKDTDTLLLYADNEVMSILPNDADESSFQKVYNLPESVGAPINSGDVIGTVDYYLAGQLVGTSQLVSHDTIERSMVMFIAGKLQEAFTSLYFRVVVAVSLVLVAIYIIFVYIKFRKHEKMQKVHRGRR